MLICKYDACESHELEQGERALFFEDLVDSAGALELVFKSEKLSYQRLGNSISHLHCHPSSRNTSSRRPTNPSDQTR